MPARIEMKAPLPRGAVVGVAFPRGYEPDDSSYGGAQGAFEMLPKGSRSHEQKLAEAVNLFEALDVDVAYAEHVNLAKISPATLLGGGVVERLAEAVKAEKLEVVMVDAILSPRQQRELEVALGAKVIDRTGVILDIFARRARTKAGKLQVEAAMLAYQQSRLVRLWSHLERQRGGMGKTGGPGERQLELDKRILRARMAKVRGELLNVERERGLQRMARQRAQVPTVALVGYTNAGKSTLFNRLVDAGTLVADALFATLDPLMRKLELPGGLEIVMVDTVGFIADLPHELVEAFKATLEEVVMADVLLHVHDASNPEMLAQAADVRGVLAQLGAGDKRVIEVYNKVDKAGDWLVPKGGMGVSALTGEGTQELLVAIAKVLQEDWQQLKVQVPASDGRRLAWLYAHGTVLSKQLDGEMWTLQVKLREGDVQLWERLK